MGAFRWPLGLAATFLASTCLNSLYANASPSIKVGLKASFSSAPYLVELLETAADENATSYFPLLDRIADGYFSDALTDEDLYNKFLHVLEDDGHMPNPETISSFQFALSMRSAAPRIEAHYQYYHTAAEPSLKRKQDTSCPVWVLFNGKQFCSPTLDVEHGEVGGNLKQTEVLQFDRILGNSSAPASILYADITSPVFGNFHKTLSKTASEGKTSYRVRHRKSLTARSEPLIIPGYGVELALKRTDYIVIDDREDSTEAGSISTGKEEVKFEEEAVADLKPLSTSELSPLAIKASSFIMQSENPLDTLVKLSQDFPKHSSAIASHNVSKDFVDEHEYNRAQLVPAGMNIMWMNGVQMIERQVEALDILDMLRKERRLINGVRNLGLTAPEAIKLLSHSEVTSKRADSVQQRFDWRDDIEGGNVIIWMNNIEKDKRYEEWPAVLTAYLQRTYPGQLPQVRRDLNNLVIPVDFASAADVVLVTETLASFVKRKLAIRIGLVPITKSIGSLQQAKVMYYLVDTYGLQTGLAYLESAYAEKGLFAPSEKCFDASVEGRKPRLEKVVRSIGEVVTTDDYEDHLKASKKWMRRLSADNKIPPVFANGVPIPRDENWLQAMSQRVSTDLQFAQQAIFSEAVEDDVWLPSLFLSQAVLRRNELIVPESEKSLRIFDVNKLLGEDQNILDNFPHVSADESTIKTDWIHAIVVADLDSDIGADLLATATVFRQSNPSIELIIIHNPSSEATAEDISLELFAHFKSSSSKAFENIAELTALLTERKTKPIPRNKEDATAYWQKGAGLIKNLGLASGQNAILLNGRLVGPVTSDTVFDLDDFESLVTYERTSRIIPALTAADALGFSVKITSPLDGAKISSIVAVSTISDNPDGIFEQASTLRMGQFDVWKSSFTAIEIGNKETSTIQLTAVLDPASQQGQRWVPILKVLSELKGVYVKLFLNPKERLQEIPVKRFYRYVLDSKPTFDHQGAVKTLSASFRGLPQEALLNLGMDIPPSWLVAPKVSVHDLDNIKLGSIKSDVEALYELEHILIEGHSRELPGGQAPRGAQLVLGTERDPHFADTIIMDNLGYFQFKANPGFYNIKLQEVRSAEIFQIDSIGAEGWSPVPGDEKTEVVLMSFKGTTLYPRISRKTGMETEDVLETKENPTDFVSRGLNFAQGILGKTKTTVKKQEQAEINIFSVASGHLYERMLNIMMVSVMKHTNHTVKFWFIEQFLSPSFKDFIPYLAAEYGFQYEMVTYKWPHWLRAQTEKQREIWGYKILFLDVLFPLSLEKVIFVDADQIVRTDMIELVNLDLKGAPYGFTPMCDSRVEMEGFRFWKQGYWEKFLRGLPYHISALYVVDLRRFRQIAAGDRLRQNYHALSADPNSLSNLDQDLPNHMQSVLPIHSLPQEWLWCETWCSDESLKEAKTIDLCNNPLTKEPKLDRARRQVPEWTVYDDEIAAVDRRRKGLAKEDEKNGKSRTLEEGNTATGSVKASTMAKKDEL